MFMFMILYITKVEIENSKGDLTLKLIMHYSHLYFRMRMTFERDNVFNKVPETADEIKGLYKKHRRAFYENKPRLTSEIRQSCEGTHFLFIEDQTLRASLRMQSQAILIDYRLILQKYQYFDEHIFKIENDAEIFELWDDMADRYQGIIDKIQANYELLSNDAYLKVIK